MRIVVCGLVGVAVLLGTAPIAVAAESAERPPPPAISAVPGVGSVGASPVDRASSQNQAAPQTGVSMLAVSLTAGGAVAAAGSGAALAVTRRRAVNHPPR
ncbi:MAG: hypothetical protein ACRDSP_15025 [Pseudonocardiaceae bacterium]